MAKRSWFKKLFGLKESISGSEPAPASAAVDFSDDEFTDVEAEKHPQSMRPQLAQRARILETVFSSQSGNPDAGTEFDDRFFRSLDQAGAMDLPVNIHHQAQRLSFLLYRKNVRATRAINLKQEFAWGDGFRIKAVDPKVQKVLDEHWRLNEWEKKAPERLRSLAIFGEQLYPAFINEGNGMVKITGVSPFRIRAITRNVDDAELLEKALVSTTGVPATGTLQTTDTKPFEIMRLNDEGQIQGEAFYFAINRVAGGTRGIPDMLSSVDWLEGLDGFLFSLLERADLAQDIVFDIEYEGANENEIRQHVKRFIRALRSGGVFGHNERVKFKIQTPNMSATINEERAASLFVKQIQAGSGMAGLFYGDASDLTRSSASELTVPVAKTFQARQNFFKGMLAEILTFQIQQSRNHGQLNGVTDFRFGIETPRIYLRDLSLITKPLNELTTSLIAAVEEGWITKEMAQRAYLAALTELGPIGDEPFGTEAGSVDDRKVAEAYDRAGKKKKKSKNQDAAG